MDERIRDILDSRLNREHYEYGFADLTGLLPGKYSAYTHGISILRRMDDSVIDAIRQGPTVDYFDLYNAVNSELNILVGQLALELQFSGGSYIAVKATVAESEIDDDYRGTLTYDISHKMIATRAGLGWIGKTDLLVSKRFGPRVRLASLLTDVRLETGNVPVDESLCGNCSVCVDNCPAHAATGSLWNVKVHRDEYFDPFKCRDYCRKISAEKIDREISLCGLCIALCPKGRGSS